MEADGAARRRDMDLVVRTGLWDQGLICGDYSFEEKFLHVFCGQQQGGLIQWRALTVFYNIADASDFGNRYIVQQPDMGYGCTFHIFSNGIE
jgi:hypothetical protein